jgi:hypothetical protein
MRQPTHAGKLQACCPPPPLGSHSTCTPACKLLRLPLPAHLPSCAKYHLTWSPVRAMAPAKLLGVLVRPLVVSSPAEGHVEVAHP